MKPKLLQAYEAILADVSNVTPPTNTGGAISVQKKHEVMQKIVKAQKNRMENRQWTWAFFGSQKTVRQTIDTMLQLVEKSSALISVGMTFAPPFVSIPWSAVSALIPLIMNNSIEQYAAIDGLKDVTEIMFAYRIAEETFLLDPNLKEDFHRAVLPLYSQILQYQAAAAVYFGRNTLSRLVRDTFAGSRWTDALTAVKNVEANSRSATGFLGGLQHQKALKNLLGILSQQSLKIAELSRDVAWRNDETTQVMLWASKVPYYQDHSQIRSNIIPPRKQWILGDDQYLVWQSSRANILFLEGTVGKGKTSLTSEVIEDVLRSPTSKVAYFYCSNAKSTEEMAASTSSRDDPLIAIRSIMAQLLLSSDGLSVAPALVIRYRNTPYKVPGGCMMTLSDCLEVLTESFLHFSNQPWTIIVDALDECKKPAELVSGLKSIVDINKNARLFLSSREGNFGPVKARYFPTMSNRIQIEQQNHEDIQNYVKIQIEIRREGTSLSDAQAIELEKVLINGAEGMFKWVVLQMDLLFPPTHLPVPKLESFYTSRIEKLKSSHLDSKGKLQETYREIFNNSTGNGVDADQYNVVCTVLRWVLYAFRSLTAQELAYASSGRSDGHLRPGLTENFILIHCANLIVKTEYDDVRLAHLSVGEFLEKEAPSEFSPENAHQKLALICCELFDGPRNSTAPMRSFPGVVAPSWTYLRQDPSAIRDRLSDYASRYWPAHCRRAARSDALENLIPHLENFTSLHEAIRASRYDILNAMIARKVHLERRDMDGYSALHEAVRLEDEDALKHLIRNGASMETQNIQGDFPIHTAATLYNKHLLERLIRNGAHIDKKNRRGVTALHIAVYRNREDAVRVLVGFGALLSPVDTRLSTPLHFASFAGLSLAINIFTSRGCDPNTPNSDGDTPLHLAARRGHIDALEVLLAAGAKADIANKAGLTPVQTARQYEQHKVITRLEIGGEPTQSGNAQAQIFPRLSILSGNLCMYCNIQKWFSSPRKGVKHGHHRTLAGLKRSAKMGCQLCDLFVRGLVPRRIDEQYNWDGIEVFVELILTVDHGRIFTLDKDLLKVSLGSVAEYLVELCVDERSGLNAFIGGTILQDNSGSEAALSLLRSWRSHCQNHHLKCRSGVGVLPKRLVDIGTNEEGISDSRLALLSGSSLPESSTPYGYLSHRYGRHEVPHSTKRIMREGWITLSEVEKTIQHTIKILRYLGIRYLWVDKLCINIADKAEMKKETERLADYARHAALVVNAGRHGDQYGLFHFRENSGNLVRLELEWSDDSSVNTKVKDSLYFRRPLRGPEECFSDDILVRAWMFQELSLPRNVILYGDDRVYWKCREMMRAEGSPWESQPLLDFGAAAEWVDAPGRGKKPVNEDQWYAMLELYSAKELALFQEKLPAARGMAMAVSSPSHSGSYRSGLWATDLHRGLLWYARTVRRSNRPGLSHTLPSWSWARLEGPVSFSLLHGMEKVSPSSESTPAILEIPSHDELAIVTRSPPNWLLDPPELEIGTMRHVSLEVLYVNNASWRVLSHNDFENPTTLHMLFDTWQDEISWRDGHEFVGVLVNKWSADGTDKTMRWIGLLLAKEELYGVRGYVRRGMLLGLWVDDDVSTWGVGFQGAVF